MVTSLMISFATPVTEVRTNSRKRPVPPYRPPTALRTSPHTAATANAAVPRAVVMALTGPEVDEA